MNEDATRWLEFAQRDLRAAEVLTDEALYAHACFHCQQSVEKALKTILAYYERKIPKIHSIAALAQEVSDVWTYHSPDDLQIFDDFYIPTRYPDALPGSLPDALSGVEDAKQALEIARDVFAEIERYLATCDRLTASE